MIPKININILLLHGYLKLVELEPLRGYPAMYEPHSGPSYGDRAGKHFKLKLKYQNKIVSFYNMYT